MSLMEVSDAASLIAEVASPEPTSSWSGNPSKAVVQYPGDIDSDRFRSGSQAKARRKGQRRL